VCTSPPSNAAVLAPLGTWVLLGRALQQFMPQPVEGPRSGGGVRRPLLARAKGQRRPLPARFMCRARNPQMNAGRCCGRTTLTEAEPALRTRSSLRRSSSAFRWIARQGLQPHGFVELDRRGHRPRAMPELLQRVFQPL